MEIDLNVDTGEGVGNEVGILPYVSSCNIACGGHYGDESSIAEVIKLAKKHQVKIGAHPSYPDRENFGRQSINLPLAEIIDAVFDQVTLFLRVAKEFDVPIHHIKPHGAFYNDLIIDDSLASAFIDRWLEERINCVLYAPYGSMVAQKAERKGVKVMFEVFADRRYDDKGRLVSRQNKDAVIDNREESLAQILGILRGNTVQTISGGEIPMRGDTICLHGDHKGAAETAYYILESLRKYDYFVK